MIRGTRVTLRTVLASLAEGATVDEVLEDFPSLTEEGVRAAIAFAATTALGDPDRKSRGESPEAAAQLRDLSRFVDWTQDDVDQVDRALSVLRDFG